MPLFARLLVATLAVAAAYLSGAAQGVWPGLAAIGLLLLLEGWRRWPLLLGLLLPAALAVGVGLVPGFTRLPLADDNLNYTLNYSLNTSKALLGVLLLGYLPLRFAFPWRDRLFQFGAFAIPLLTLGLALAVGYLRWQPPALEALLVFTFGNAFSVLAEEGFFRGLVQTPLRRQLSRWPTLLLVALLFGVVHLGGGLVFAAFATLAGFGYALAFERSQSLWAVVLVHLGLNIARVAIGG